MIFGIHYDKSVLEFKIVSLDELTSKWDWGDLLKSRIFLASGAGEIPFPKRGGKNGERAGILHYKCPRFKTANLCEMRNNWIYVIVISLSGTKGFFSQNQGS